ncbi:MAG TPA: HAD-IA family hydrolase [Minicystis sp.]|nr:HAD-IA family hydrolase [Minicystis sp.]
MLPPAAVIFDLDGTLLDSRGDIVAAVNHALRTIGRAPQPATAIVRYVGDGARALCARAAHLSEFAEEVDVMIEAFTRYYSEHPVEFTRFMPGVQEALEQLGELPEMQLGICTNKPRQTTDAVLGALGIRTRFRAVVAGGDVSEKKPAPGPLLHLAKLMHVPIASMIMVGDGPQDVECAHRAGCRSIAVESPFAFRERVLAARPDVTIGDLRELVDIVRRWREATARISIG